ncbi:hypothetical protein ACFFJY_09345 [Fictibacillus aquaticus]|uniref:Uncharacterized protein n=1 Tax=Fictibacillus aquaticus TaxID=2021314 RepID=A0A235FB04_9BACL|nr:hypothetical protein [Fictibacillus aquaticus]OYD58478.1 hypothetical protein CGZ90_00835 [Fictibacillus aquaticus]
MPTNISLKIKENHGGEEVVTTRQFTIEDISLDQFNQLMVATKDIIHQLKDDHALKAVIDNIFSGIEDENNELAMDLVNHLVNSFETLAVSMPEQATRLLSILSGIDANVLKGQKLMTVLDVYDAVIEENDVERLMTRVKKSLALTAAKINFQNFMKKVTGKTSA